MKEIGRKKDFQNCSRAALGIIIPDGSQHLFSFSEFFFCLRIGRCLSRQQDCLQPMSKKQERLEQGDVLAAMAFQKSETVSMKIEGAVGRPGGKLLEVIVDDIFGSDYSHSPTELGATPCPIKIAI